MEFRFVLNTECNFNCYFCLREYCAEKILTNTLKPKDYLKIVQFGKKSLKITDVTLTGGEPLINKNFDEIVETIRVEGCNITLITNGSLLDKHVITIASINELHVSFHTFNDNDWERITGVNKHYKEIVKNNIIYVRKLYPHLRIKLNIVSEKANNSDKCIIKYLNFAEKYNLILNVFQESYLRWAKQMGFSQGINFEPEPIWDITPYSPILIEQKKRKKTYKIGNVIVALCSTSVEKQDFESIWVDQLGFSYMDIFNKKRITTLRELINHNSIDLNEIKGN